jgi:hypothetical protein
MFPTLQTALTEVKLQTQISDTDTTFDNTLTIFLEASKGCIKASQVTEYRPYIVAARFLAINPLRDGIVKASGTDTVEWQNPQIKIDGLLNLQRNLDKTLGCIDPAWSTVDSNRVLHTFAAFTV